MNKKAKISLRILEVVVIVAGIGALLYFLAFVPAVNYFEKVGYNIALTQAVSSVQTYGYVKINNMTLVQQQAAQPVTNPPK